MTPTRTQLERQFQTAEKAGWLPFCEQAALDHGLNPALILAIASRETNLDPKYLRIAGDGGNGFGLTQADRRTYAAFVSSGNWKDAEKCFDFAAQKIANDKALILTSEGQTCRTRFRSGEKREFTGAQVEDADALRIAISGYNCGAMTAYYHYSKGRSSDTGTTGKDYCADVLERAALFQVFWAARSKPVIQPEPEPEPIETEAKLEPIEPPKPNGKKNAGLVGIGAAISAAIQNGLSWLSAIDWKTHVIIALAIVAIVFIWREYKCRAR